MTAFQDAFSVTGIDRDLAERLDAAKNVLLGYIGEQGYDVEVSHDLDDLADFWRDNRDAEDLLRIPNFDVRFWPNHGRTDTLLFFLTKDGRRVGACGYRLVRLIERERLAPLTLRESFECLNYFYESPREMAPSDARCECRLTLAQFIEGQTVCAAGALWFQEKHRRLDLWKALSRLSRILTVTRRDFFWSWMIVVFTPENMRLALDHFGFRGYFPEVISYGGRDDWWMAMASLAETCELALKPNGALAALDRPFR